MAVVNRVPPSTRVTFDRITTDRVELYCHVPPPGDNIHVFIEPLQVDELVPTEDEIEWAVKQLRNHRSGTPSGIRADQLKR